MYTVKSLKIQIHKFELDLHMAIIRGLVVAEVARQHGAISLPVWELQARGLANNKYTGRSLVRHHFNSPVHSVQSFS